MDNIDFKALEDETRWHYYEDKKARANALGYEYIPEAFYDLFYVKHKPIAEICKLLEYSSKYGMVYFFRKHGWKLGKRGGARNFDLLFPHIKDVLQDFATWKEENKGDLTLKPLSERLAVKYGVSAASIYYFLRGRTWKKYSPSL